MDHIIFEDFPKICRLCLSFGILQPITEINNFKILSAITNINVQEEKLPQNICNDCVKQLENMSSFITTCENSDQTLKTIILETFNTNLVEEVESGDKDLYNDSDDLKNEDNNSEDAYYELSIKQEEFIIEPDFDGAINEDIVSCQNCSENFPDIDSLNDHYKEIVMCRPRGYDVNTSSVPNIIDYLKKSRKVKRPREKKEILDDGEPEFIKGRQLKGKRRFLCSYCGKNYTRKNGLDRHILSHTGVKPFECKECGKRYITKDTLKTHLLTHTGVKSHKCTLCQKMFTQSSHLSYHMRRHAGEKPYSCTFCGKGFLSNYHLERHKLMHTGVKPFECNQCGKQFVRGTTLRDHLLIHTGEKPFQCQHCGKQFNRKQSLTNHVLVHTGNARHGNNSGRIIRLHSSGLVDTIGPTSDNNIGLSRGEHGEELLILHDTNMSVIGQNSSGGDIALNNSESGTMLTIGTNIIYDESNPVNGSY